MFNNLPILSQEKALHILSMPLERLELASDYYKAISHLLEYPGSETEDALINFLKKENDLQAIKIAKRKAIEVLAKLKCFRSIPDITVFLKSDDPYMVENSVLALQKLSCEDIQTQDFILSLLEDPRQNRRILIQSLAAMRVTRLLPKLKELLQEKTLPNGVYGAAISAISKLTREKYRFEVLENLLQVSNQNDRQTAVEDIIDAGAIDLIPSIVRTPISPFFRLRAINKLWPAGELNFNQIYLIDLLDDVINDHPKQLRLINKENHTNKSIKFLINQFFNTDFNKSYIALSMLIKLSPEQLWEEIMIEFERINKDYGAIYFLVKLFTFVSDWDDDQIGFIVEFSKSLLNSDWPDYMKFKPAAIFICLSYDFNNFIELVPTYVDSKLTPYWACRYSALRALELNSSRDQKLNIRSSIELAKKDFHPFVALKAKSLVDFSERLKLR